jgi:ribosomal protein S1
VSDKNELENQRIIEQFQHKLHGWKVKYNIENSLREAQYAIFPNITIRNLSCISRSINSAVNPSSTATNKSVKKDSYTKNYVLSAEKEGNGVKFFNNDFFRTHLQQYLSNTYSIECYIRLTELQDIDIELVGIKHNVKTARETIKNLFESVREKIFNREDTDQQSKTPNPIFTSFTCFIFQ